jgi:hypothetical protein
VLKLQLVSNRNQIGRSLIHTREWHKTELANQSRPDRSDTATVIVKVVGPRFKRIRRRYWRNRTQRRLGYRARLSGTPTANLLSGDFLPRLASVRKPGFPIS